MRSFFAGIALVVAALGTSGITGCASESGAPQEEASAEADQSTAARIGSHGMVLAGDAGHAVLSHIPTYSAPHDVQLIVLGAMTATAPGSPLLPATFSDRAYTFLPERTSLDALRLGTTRELSGTVYLGNFEQGGRPVAAGVKLAVERVLHQHILVAAPVVNAPGQGSDAGAGADAGPPSTDLTYLVFGSRARTFAVHLIAAAPSFDEVLTVTLDGPAPSDADLSRGVIARAAGTRDTMASRAGARSGASMALTVAASPATFAMRPLKTLSCLQGPGFFETCE